MGYPSDAEKQCILDLYLDRFGVNNDLTRHRLQRILIRDLGGLHLVPAHIEEFVKAGVKRARLARRMPEFSDSSPASMRPNPSPPRSRRHKHHSGHKILILPKSDTSLV